MDNVVLRLLVPVCTVLRREREQQIHDLALHDVQLHNELTAYQRSQIDVEVVIRKILITSHRLYTKNPAGYREIFKNSQVNSFTAFVSRTLI